ncbi:MAG: hypothetical protein AAFU49_13645 [Pseudomonadota bacterium]
MPKICGYGVGLAAAAGIAVAVGIAALKPLTAEAQMLYTLNGVILDTGSAQMMARGGMPPGHYWIDGSGNWGRVGKSNPIGNINGVRPGIRSGGAGEQYGNGSWSFGGGAAPRGGMGGTADGCLYTAGWSNC